MEKVAEDPFKPNGICFSADYKKLYIADTGSSHYPEAKNIIWGYDVDGKKLKNGRKYADMDLNGKSGFADGIRCDADGIFGRAHGRAFRSSRRRANGLG